MILGDRRSSQLLQKMHTLDGKKITEEGLKVLWLQRLPVSMQQILSVSSEDLTGKSRSTVVCEPPLRLTLLSCDEKYDNLLNKYKKITTPYLKRPSGHSPVTHFIFTKCPPVAIKARRLSPEQLEAVKKEISSLIAQGICKPSCSPCDRAPYI
ncbi:hypothetical protein TNCT_588411 [Trichonephila clavata]|uniref:Uncharacterized protein n=1 Tax=Trichonephila clavata TaxID=2740835 RepID=A0A8X6LC16_TRICU|nr:hypothetical protein TNCT_588411 [Trichonephila clavata]